MPDRTDIQTCRKTSTPERQDMQTHRKAKHGRETDIQKDPTDILTSSVCEKGRTKPLMKGDISGTKVHEGDIFPTQNGKIPPNLM